MSRCLQISMVSPLQRHQDLVPLILGARANQDARDGDGWTGQGLIGYTDDTRIYSDYFLIRMKLVSLRLLDFALAGQHCTMLFSTVTRIRHDT